MTLEFYPRGFRWQSNPSFVILTVGLGLLTDLVLYGSLLPIIPFSICLHFGTPLSQIHARYSELLAIHSVASLLFVILAKWLASQIGSRKLFLVGLKFLGAAIGVFALAQSFRLLVVSQVLQGASTAAVWTSGMDTVQQAVPRTEVGETIRTIFRCAALGGLVVPVLGGFSYNFGHRGMLLGISVALLVVDLALCFLVIDRKTTARYYVEDGTKNEAPPGNNAGSATARGIDLRPERPFDGRGNSRFTRNEQNSEIQRKILKFMPTLLCFRSLRLHTAVTLPILQALLPGALNSLVPAESESLYGLPSFQVGISFAALMVTFITLGGYFNRTVDHHDTWHIMITVSILLLSSILAMVLSGLNLVVGRWKIVLLCAVLAIRAFGVAITNRMAYVESIALVGRYERANPNHPGNNGPYAQLFGLNTLYLFANLGLSSLTTNYLIALFGWDVTGAGAVFAVIAALAAGLWFSNIGSKHEPSSRKYVSAP